MVEQLIASLEGLNSMELINSFTDSSLSLKVSVDDGQLWCAKEAKRIPHVPTGLLQEIVCFIRPPYSP